MNIPPMDTPQTIATDMIAEVGRARALGHLVMRLCGCDSLRAARRCAALIVAVLRA